MTQTQFNESGAKSVTQPSRAAAASITQEEALTTPALAKGRTR